MISYFEFYGFITPITADKTTFEIFFNEIENLTSVFVLTYRKTRPEFPSKQSFRFFIDRDRKTSFTINITGYIFRNVLFSEEVGV